MYIAKHQLLSNWQPYRNSLYGCSTVKRLQFKSIKGVYGLLLDKGWLHSLLLCGAHNLLVIFIQAVSCAGIGSVEYTELNPMGDYIGHTFKCQTSITYQVSLEFDFNFFHIHIIRVCPSPQVATSPCDGNEFLTCEERGLVRLFDLRVKSSCHCNGCLKVR